MFKKASKIVVSFCVLAVAYAGYTGLFAFVTSRLEVARADVEVAFPESDPDSAKRARQLALESFGPTHFGALKENKLQYYDSSRGFYMYAQEKEILGDNKRIKVHPFALVWVSKDGKSRKTATSDWAIIDLSQPFMQVKPSLEPSKVTHARLEGDVRLRDDKGTRDDPSDDLRVGPLTYVEFDDASLQITSDSDVFLQDRDLTLNGTGLMIQLRRKVPQPDDGGGSAPASGGPGFDAETAFIYKDVHIVVNDVTSDGVLPGKSRPEKTGKTPIDVRSDREMRIDLPRPRPPVLVGPPDLNRPPDPTFVKFKTNVRVIRGTDKADQLNCDTLDLTLRPDVRKPATDEPDEAEGGLTVVSATPKAAEPSAQGPLTELKIRVAKAKGDAVWLQSEAQGMVARCVELIYEKHGDDGQPDVTYLNGGSGKKLWVEKVDLDPKAAPGTIKAIMRLTSLDATIFDSGPGGTSRIIARGPGKTEEWPARNASVVRTVWWEDEMELITWRDGEGAVPTPSPLAARSLNPNPPRPVPPKGTLRRLVTLTGPSKLVDHATSTTLDARKSIVAEFQALPNVAPLQGEGPTQIQWLDAYEDAHLTAPSKALTARQLLKVKFENAPAPVVIVAAPAAPAPAPAAGPVVVVTEVASPEPKPDQAPKAPDPMVDGRADRVWATVLLGATGEGVKGSKGELKNAQLRGGVMVHQDPAPGKAYGADASGEALDLAGQGDGLMEFKVKADEPPQAFDPKTRLASESKRREPLPTRLARVEFEGKLIESVDIIGLNQKANFAWVLGSGTFTQMVEKGLLDDKGIEGEKRLGDRKVAGPVAMVKEVVTWTDEMRFYGSSTDLEGRPAAKIEFRGSTKEVRTPDGRKEFRHGVEAKQADSALYADLMDVYLDRPVSFAREARKPSDNPDDPKPADPQIAMIDCKGRDLVENGLVKHPGVDIISQKLFPENGELKEKQRIQGQHVIYDKRTGEFEAFGPGLAWLYRRKAGESKGEGLIPTALPVALPSSNAAGSRPKPDGAASARKLSPIELTKIKFAESMQGRFGVAREKAEPERRDAEFHGAVQAVDATVSTKNSDIDFDHLDRRSDLFFLTSDVLNVFSYPAPVGLKVGNKQLLFARGNALARANNDAIQSDRITYDSSTGLTYAYGDEGKEVAFTKQESTGQAPNTVKMKSLRYNNLNRESETHDPQAISFTDLKSGIRSKPGAPDLGGSPRPADPIKMPRQPFQRQGRGATERNGFNGH